MARSGPPEKLEEGVRFSMSRGAESVSVFVSCQALECIDAGVRATGVIERFGEYRTGFEEIAMAKYDRGHLERDGSICIRSRDLPGVDH